MYVYVKSQCGLWTVGFYDPSGEWQPDSDHSSSDEAAKRVAWLNGGELSEDVEDLCAQMRSFLALDVVKEMFREEREYNEAMADAADASRY